MPQKEFTVSHMRLVREDETSEVERRLSDEELIDRAIKAHLRRVGRLKSGVGTPVQPSSLHSTVENGVVFLRNSYDTLGRYAMKGGRMFYLGE